ncbi:hypothetical protein CHUAL_001272 [Chamberlinius hualienensis]
MGHVTRKRLSLASYNDQFVVLAIVYLSVMKSKQMNELFKAILRKVTTIDTECKIEMKLRRWIRIVTVMSVLTVIRCVVELALDVFIPMIVNFNQSNPQKFDNHFKGLKVTSVVLKNLVSVYCECGFTIVAICADLFYLFVIIVSLLLAESYRQLNLSKRDELKIVEFQRQNFELQIIVENLNNILSPAILILIFSKVLRTITFFDDLKTLIVENHQGTLDLFILPFGIINTAKFIVLCEAGQRIRTQVIHLTFINHI